MPEIKLAEPYHRVRIVSDGTIEGTHIYAKADDGSEHEILATKLAFSFGIDGIDPTVVVTMPIPYIDVLVDAGVIKLESDDSGIT